MISHPTRAALRRAALASLEAIPRATPTRETKRRLGDIARLLLVDVPIPAAVALMVRYRRPRASGKAVPHSQRHTARLEVRLAPEVAERIRVAAAARGVPISEIVASLFSVSAR